MEATAKATYVRISPRKVQIVLDLIRNQPGITVLVDKDGKPIVTPLNGEDRS